MTSKPNVLVVHNYYKIPGGEDTVAENEIEILRENGHKVVFYKRSNSEMDSFSALKKLMLPFTAIFSIRTYRDIVRLIRNENIDVVHVHNTLSLISPAVYYAARHCKVPVVQTVHNFRLLCPGASFYRDGNICEDCTRKGLGCAVRHACYRQSKAQTLVCVASTVFHRMTGIYGKINYICLTAFNREKLLALKQIKPERVFVKPNFVNINREMLPTEERSEQIVFAGRLDKLKGVEVLLEAWRIMGDSAPKLVLCGVGPMKDWCRKFIEAHKLNVEMKGFIENREVIKLLAGSKAMILPTQWYEGFPMSIVESLSVGTPVLCSNIGNADAIIAEGVTGCKFTPDSPESIVDAIDRLGEFHENARREYEQSFISEINYRQLSDIYLTVIEDAYKIYSQSNRQ